MKPPKCRTCGVEGEWNHVCKRGPKERVKAPVTAAVVVKDNPKAPARKKK